MSMITATTWVPRGCAASFPTRYELNEEEFDRIASLARLRLDDAKIGLEEARAQSQSYERPAIIATANKSNGEVDEDLKEYDLEHYDNEPSELDTETDGDVMGIFSNIKSLAYHEDEEQDPYITLQRGDEDDEEREELQILSTDNLVLAARVEDEVAHLEVYVYEDEEDNLYVHHDIMLPAIPLAVEWLDLPVGRSSLNQDAKANFVAIGTMDPDIEVWDLDVVDCMYPNAILGQGSDEMQNGVFKSEGHKKRRKRSRKANDNYHVDAVLSLAANRQHRNLLASSSADKTIKLWDLNTAKCAKSYKYHTDKVCALAWHPEESTALLSGSYDRTVIACDMRAPEQGIRRWTLDSDVESVRWDPHDSHYFYVSTDSGLLMFFDARMVPSSIDLSSPVWRLQAHDQSVSCFDVNPIIPGFLSTGSTDKEVKLWNVQATGPSMVVSRDLGVGKVFSAQFAPDKEVGFRLAVAGSKGNLQIWDTSTNAAVRQAFAGRVIIDNTSTEERLVGLRDESSESEDGVDEAEAEEDVSAAEGSIEQE